MAEKQVLVFQSANTSSSIVPNLQKAFDGIAAVKTISPRELGKTKKIDESTIAFILPGIIGEDSTYHHDIGRKGNKKITGYVEDGGVFMGICAGAYYAARQIIYEPPWRTAPKTRKPGLDFFNGIAKGPLNNLAVNDFDSWFSDLSVTMLTTKNDKGYTTLCGTMYGNGPVLLPDTSEKDLCVIARYDDAPDKPIAIASKNIKDGLAIFSGALPYIDYMPVGARGGAYQKLHDLMQQIRPYETERARLWNGLVNDIIDHNIRIGRLAPSP